MIDFSFKGIDAADKNFIMQDIISSLLADQKESIINIPKAPGLIQLYKKFMKRRIIIRGIISGTSNADLIEKIRSFSEFIFSEVDEQLIFSDQSDRYYLAQHLESINFRREPTFVILNLKFLCNDPFAYAITGDEVNKIGITTKGYTWNISNLGQYYAYPLITITFNQSQTHIYIQNNNIVSCRFDISKSFSNGEVLKVDSKLMKILLDNVHSPAGFGDGGDEKAEFILLRVGNNEFEVGTDDATLNVDIKINFNKTYL